MLLLLAAAGLAWGFARVLDAPRWVERSIPPVVLAVMALAMVALPAGHPFRDSIASGVRGLLVLTLIALPFVGYALLIRRIRRRTMPEAAPAPIKGQIVRIGDDMALRTEYGLRRQGAEPGFSLIRRRADGSLDIVAIIDREGRRLIVSLLWFDARDIRELAEALRTAAEEEGAAQVVVTTDRAEALEDFRAHGYQEAGRVRLDGEPDLVTLVWTHA